MGLTRRRQPALRGVVRVARAVVSLSPVSGRPQTTVSTDSACRTMSYTWTTPSPRQTKGRTRTASEQTLDDSDRGRSQGDLNHRQAGGSGLQTVCGLVAGGAVGGGGVARGGLARPSGARQAYDGRWWAGGSSGIAPSITRPAWQVPPPSVSHVHRPCAPPHPLPRPPPRLPCSSRPWRRQRRAAP